MALAGDQLTSPVPVEPVVVNPAPVVPVPAAAPVEVPVHGGEQVLTADRTVTDAAGSPVVIPAPSTIVQAADVKANVTSDVVVPAGADAEEVARTQELGEIERELAYARAGGLPQTVIALEARFKELGGEIVRFVTGAGRDSAGNPVAAADTSHTPVPQTETTSTTTTTEPVV